MMNANFQIYNKMKTLPWNKILPVLMFLIFLSLICYETIKWWYKIPGENLIKFDDCTKLSLKIITSEINSIASLTIALIGSIGGILIFGKKTIGKIKGFHEWIFFILGGVSLLISYTAYLFANQRFVESLWNMHTMDMTSEYLSFWPKAQYWFFIVGVVNILFFAFEIYFRKEKNKNEE